MCLVRVFFLIRQLNPIRWNDNKAQKKRKPLPKMLRIHSRANNAASCVLETYVLQSYRALVFAFQRNFYRCFRNLLMLLLLVQLLHCNFLWLVLFPSHRPKWLYSHFIVPTFRLLVQYTIEGGWLSHILYILCGLIHTHSGCSADLSIYH